MKLARFCFTPLAILSFFLSSAFAASPVRINEFLASNSSGLADEDGAYSDWIELFNSSTQPVSLSQWSLTDESTNLSKWEFPAVIIPANGYIIVFASGKNRNTPKLHTNFSLSETGEYLALVQPDGTIATEFSPAYPSQRPDVSYGYDASGNLVFFTSPTPGAVNGGGVVDFVADTKFSQDRGFFDAPFDVVITTATPGATIRYTTNGLAPSATTGLVYSGPLHIASTTTIRTAAFKTGFQPSDVDTQTYIFLDDVIHQAPTGAAPPGWPASWGANSVDYGMDPDVVNNPKYSGTIKDDLKTIPSFSIVLKLADLFDPTTGIYANASQDGASWERPCSVELIYPDGTKGFQIDAGIRIRGGFSRSTGNPKHAFRLFFRKEYGAGKLKYPLFGKEGTDTFDGFDIRTFQNYSWSFQGDANGIFLRDQFSRDTQLAMGYEGERGNFCHLFINGEYWGLYNTCERPEASYGATYFGGNKEDYDVIKVEAGPYTINATDGTMTAWTTLYNMAKAGLSSDAAFQRVLGNNPDGTPNPNYPVYIDLPNLIDYMLLIFWSGNKDAPISNFLSDQSPNNWYGVRNRNLAVRMGFQFFAHDSEHTLLPWDININRLGPFSAGDSSVTKSSPQYIWKQMTANAEFRLKVADHVQKHFFNGGLLTPQANLTRLMKRKAEIDRAVVGESARWGDAKVATPYTRDTWLAAINNVTNNFLPTRTQIVLDQLKAAGLYPSVAAPAFTQRGGNVNPGFSLTISAPAGTIYYTLDGSDPRLMGGSVSAKALTYSGRITLNANATVSARALSGGTWSAMEQGNFTIIRTFKELMITELMYHPPDLGTINSDDLEFIEFKNVGAQELDLSGIHFTNGVQYTFPNGTHLAAGAFYLIVSNPTNFVAKYPTTRFDGVYTNNLSNSGEAIALVHAAGAPIAQFTYSDGSPWPTAADGAGFSLVPRTLDPNVDYNDPGNWRASSRAGGSPGADDPPADIQPIVINEILLHTEPLLPESGSQPLDSIELYNPTGNAVDLSGWYLSNDSKTPALFRIPNGTIIAAGAYTVLNKNGMGASFNFPFKSSGGEVYLTSAALDGALTGYGQGFKYPAPEFLVSFGRYTNSVGEVSYPAQKSSTLGTANAGPRIGPVVINEIQYNPALGGDEFIELKNISGTAVPLYDPSYPTNTWKLAGLGYTFPQDLQIPAGGIIVLSGIDPQLFRQHTGLPAQIPVYGPFTGNLQGNGELLELLRAGSPAADGVPYSVVDSVRYSNNHPWPTNSAGTGSSIERRVSADFGNDPANWRSSPGPASPGLDNDGNRLPIVDAGQDVQLVSAAFPVLATITGLATDDGLPNPPGALSYEWTQVSGPGPAQIQNPSQLAAVVAFPGVGVYGLRFTVSDGEYTVSDDMFVSISRPLSTLEFVAKNSIWKYLDNGSNQGSAWQGVDFDDSSWKSGPGILGYGDPNSTTIGFGPDSSAKYTTTYFRHAFTVSGARGVVSLNAELLRDDGAVVYLNGTEVFRSNMPAGVVTYTTAASEVIGGSDEITYFDYPVDPSVLREGKNTLAVEIHQQNGASSDVSFDLELSGTVNFSNQAPTANAGPDLTVNAGETAALRGTAGDDGLPNPPGVFNASWSIVSGPGSVTFGDSHAPATTATFSAGGTYVLRLNVTDGELTASDDVQVTVTGDDPFVTWKASHFTPAELNDPSVSGDNADPDGDSFTNQQEFIAGTDPKNALSFLHVATVDLEGADVVIRFEAVGDKSYTILGRDDITSGLWERVLDLSPQGSTKSVDVLDTLGQSQNHKFYRIVTPQIPLQ
ncbi:MAG TPA: lamin tail domain-containing protein [Verrucomicrobiae bacterium]|nr:lamin tail domain-containing protein [Verrucomicrobiae bacterium]